ncbi:ADP-ribosylglycohydrolase family protein [Ectothiorhodospiraceae bacterium WFHF3C12]|nr:ADP-ribosylglycohydrolase family protein [Ectothiorhodospiraceae bacterium WFHF3C12]
MLGAIAGDVIGSVHEGAGTKRTDFPLFVPGSTFTDDSVLTVATAEVLLGGGDYRETYQRYFREYPDSGFGGMFASWAASGAHEAYGSFGNGAAMRVAPIGWWARDRETVLAEARRSAEVSHDHPQGVLGAQASALAVFLARGGVARERLRREIEALTGYDLSRRLDDIRPGYRFDVTCQGSVPESLIAFLESRDFEDAIRKAISLGGDADTMAAICGGVAEAYYGGVPAAIAGEVRGRLPGAFVGIVDRFMRLFGSD